MRKNGLSIKLMMALPMMSSSEVLSYLILYQPVSSALGLKPRGN